jgi:hypothetical protein
VSVDFRSGLIPRGLCSGAVPTSPIVSLRLQGDIAAAEREKADVLKREAELKGKDKGTTVVPFLWMLALFFRSALTFPCYSISFPAALP